MKSLATPFVLALMSLSSGVVVVADTIFITPNGNDNNTGTSWELAKKTMAGGINVAVSGDQIWVAAGTYYGCITLKSGTSLYGGFAGNETDLSQRNISANAAILDGQMNGSVVTSPSGADRTTRIDGFTIRNGYGTYLSTLHMGDYVGGGIYCNNSSPTITNNKITENRIIHINNAWYGVEDGAAIYCESSTASITNNTIVGNYAYSEGGGIDCRNASPVIDNNTIIGNSAGFWGGGIECYGSSPTIKNNVIMNNDSGSGAGIACQYSSPSIVSNLISKNTTNGYEGGGIYIDPHSSPSIVNNTITENTAGRQGGGGIACFSPPSKIVNNIIAFNNSGIFNYASYGTPTLYNNCVYNPSGFNYSGLSAGAGDISLDPLFVDYTTGNYHLIANSPCINTGKDSYVQSGWLDMDGQPRILGSHVDIGADEFLPGDCNSDSHVTPADLLIVMGSLDMPKTNPGADARADLDGDGFITSSDMAIVLGNME